MKKSKCSESPKPAESAPLDPVGERIKRRVSRWEAKYKPERIAAILAAKSERMRENYAVQAEMLGRVDHRVSEVIDAVGVSVIVRIWYKSFGREVGRIWRTIPSSCQELEYDVVRYKWTARGLDPILLVKVKTAVIEFLEASGFPRKGDEPENQDGSLLQSHKDTKPGPDGNTPRPLGGLGDLGGSTPGSGTRR